MTIQQNYPAIKPTLNLDFANTKQLDPRITYSRASTGTYYDGKTVAKAEENLLTYSQDFVNWTEGNGCTVTADSTAAPDGTTTADLLIPSTASLSYHVRTSNSFTTQAASILSVYVKPSGYNYLSVVVSSNTGRANIEVSTGSITNYGTNAFTVNSIALANGWYRLVITVPVAFSAANVWLGPNSAVRDPLAIWAGDGTSGAYLWGAQLEQRSTATAYTPTTTAPITNYIPVLQTASAGTPRFDHNPITGESLGLLIEEQRTNLVTYSEQFDNAAWTKSNATVTANTIVAPDGTLTGDKLVENTANSDHRVGQSSGVVGGSETLSVYAKAAERSWMVFQLGSNSVAYFNLANGTLGNVTGGTATITAVGGGWYRCSITGIRATNLNNLIFMTTGNGTATYAGDGTSGIYIWGAQLEAGAFATSYIPTVASQVTRAADSASMTGTNFSSWYNQSEGTLYSDWDYVGAGSATSASNRATANISDGTSSNRLQIYNISGNTGAFIAAGNASQAALDTLIPTAVSTSVRGALAYAANNAGFSRNGGTVLTDTSVTIPSVNALYIGSEPASQRLNGHLARIAYYPRRITNTQLQALTS